MRAWNRSQCAPDHSEYFAASHVLYNLDSKLVLTFVALG